MKKNKRRGDEMTRMIRIKVAALVEAAGMAGEFRSLHNMAIDSNGNIYTAEAGYGRRVQKFKMQ